MATYKGVRSRGDWLVTVDGSPLPPRLDLKNHSPEGFAWGYLGSGPAQLGLAILAYHFADTSATQEQADLKALQLYQSFKEKLIAPLPEEGWQFETYIVADTVELILKEEARRTFDRVVQLELENAALQRDLSECYALLEHCNQ